LANIPHFGLDRQYNNLKDELLEATDLAMRDGILIGGEYTVMFEEWLKERTGCEYATVTHSGTQALELLAAYHADVSFLAGEDESPTVLIPNLTYPATFNAFYSAGYNVELVDVDKNGLMLMNTEMSDFNTYRIMCFHPAIL
jgi:dTDP-4-amino-4,6-dideoxygalactose transaminase